ncbi:MAG: serine/threonine-protein phosphatase [Anaerolineales bacterium]|nr:serine/threonine-protein phosphatase [Anaerolineales bacterium]
MSSIFKKLRSKKRTQPLAQTKVNTIPLTFTPEQIATRIEPSQLIAGCGQSVGRQRDHNEDCLFAISFCMAGESSFPPMGLYIVADGMGGHQYGEVASRSAVRSLSGHLLRKMHPYLVDPTQSMDESLQEMMTAAIYEAQHAVTKAAPGSGTTLTAALVLGQQMIIAHVGDSRAYTIRPDGRVEALTRDHSLVRRLEELGHITPEEAATRPDRNVLYRAIGQGEALEPDIFVAPFPQPGYLLLCSDGLWGVISESELLRIVLNSRDLTSACQEMVKAANEAGGPDNISAVLVQLL